jgi:hypothetical protein
MVCEPNVQFAALAWNRLLAKVREVLEKIREKSQNDGVMTRKR